MGYSQTLEAEMLEDFVDQLWRKVVERNTWLRDETIEGCGNSIFVLSLYSQ